MLCTAESRMAVPVSKLNCFGALVQADNRIKRIPGAPNKLLSIQRRKSAVEPTPSSSSTTHTYCFWLPVLSLRCLPSSVPVQYSGLFTRRRRAWKRGSEPKGSHVDWTLREAMLKKRFS